MQKPLVLLIIAGSLIGLGIALSFYGAQLTTENLSVQEGSVLPAESLEVLSELDPSISELGVFVVQMIAFSAEPPTDESITAKVFDPFGSQIVSKPIDRESFEDRFEISSSGTYRLVIENSGQEEIQIIGVIGHMPDTSTLSIGITGFYIIIVGLIGLVGIGIYAVRNRRKEKFS